MTESDLQFDTNGFLTPYGPVSSTLETVQRVFVEGFATSTTRSQHFERYQACNARLLAILPNGFTQWIDGSFVSRKTNPGDIDVLTFVDATLHQQHEKTIRALRSELATGDGRVDLHTILVYDEGHPYRNRHESDRVQWLFDWSQTITRPRYNKGFIELLIK